MDDGTGGTGLPSNPSHIGPSGEIAELNGSPSPGNE